MNSQFFHKIRSLIFSPESNFELFVRTLYHRIAKNFINFLIQDRLAQRSYQRFRESQQSQPTPDPEAFPNQPKITFLLPFSTDQTDEIVTTLKSIQNLDGTNWEVILLSDQNIIDNLLLKEISQDANIKVAAPNNANILYTITGQFVVFCQPGDRFFKSFLSYFYKAFDENPSADLIYYDCEYQDGDSEKIKPFFKPATISPALLLSINYLSRSFIRTSSIKEIFGKVNTSNDLIAKEYEIALRLCRKNANIIHIPSILISQTDLVVLNTPERRTVVIEHLSLQGLDNVDSVKTSIGSRFIWKTGKPDVDIVIPTKNNGRFLEPLLKSIFWTPIDQHLHIYIVDNNSIDEDTLSYYNTIRQEQNVTLIPYPKPFNYSEAINLGVAESQSDLILLMNDDMAVKDPDWLSELTQWAIRPEVGVVGAKLLRANHSIQHAGIIMGLVGFVGHIYLNAPDHYTGLFGSVDWYRDYLAVTGALQMFRREVFDEVGGYDENYQLAFGDIKFCLQVYEHGYRVVYTPFANLYHYEGRSRGYITPVEDILKGYQEMNEYLSNEDPYFSPNLTYTRVPKCISKARSKKDRLNQIEERRKFYMDNLPKN